MPIAGGCSGSLLQREERLHTLLYMAHSPSSKRWEHVPCWFCWVESCAWVISGGLCERRMGQERQATMLRSPAEPSKILFCQNHCSLAFKLQLLPSFLQGECIWPSGTVGGIKKSRLTAPLPHSYLLYHGLQQLHWASTWHTCLVCASISVSPSSPLIYIATFIAAISPCFTCYN